MTRLASPRALFLALVLTACTGSEAAVQDTGTLPEAPARRRAASRVQQVAASAENASFTAVPRLDVDSRGFIYVPDTYQQRVTVLGPDGTLTRTFGRRGSGPNEFRALGNVQVLPGDSLLVYDPELGRVSIYAPDSGSAAYQVNFAGKMPGVMPREAWRTHANDAMLALFTPGFAFGSGQDFNSRRDKLRVLELDGTIRNELMTYPSRAFLVAGTSITPHPFGHEGFARIGSHDQLHFIWSDTLAIDRYSLDGARQARIQFDYVPPPVTPADVEDAVGRFPEGVRAQFQPVLADSAPERWPAVRQALIDDRDRLWLALGGSLRQETEWAAFSAQGEYLGSVLIPIGSDVRLIRADGTIYTERVDEDDVPQVVVYRMTRPLR